MTYIVKHPLYKRLILQLALLVFKAYFSFRGFFSRIFGETPPKPTLSLTFPQSTLPSRWSPNKIDIFFPAGYEQGKQYPVYLDLAGGSFFRNRQHEDRPWCRSLSDIATCIVISLPYRTAPFTKFPSQIYDVAALVHNILTDPRIATSIHAGKVAIGGFSAGANIATAVSLIMEMRGVIGALVPIYPVLDFTTSMTIRAKANDDGLGGVKGKVGVKDLPPGVAFVEDMFVYGYMHKIQDLHDSRLSPMFAGSWQLPGNVYVVGAEKDVFCRDAILFHRKFSPHLKNMKLNIVPDMPHAFTHEHHLERNKAMQYAKRKATRELCHRIADWLTVDVWKTRDDDSRRKGSRDEDGNDGRKDQGKKVQVGVTEVAESSSSTI